MPRRTPENAVKDDIKAIFASMGVNYFARGAAIFGKPGVSDFIAWPAGLFLAVEAKATDKSDIRPSQLRFLKEVRAGGGCGLIIHKDNLVLLRETLTRMLRGEKF